jgi:hypothetical protein
LGIYWQLPAVLSGAGGHRLGIYFGDLTLEQLGDPHATWIAVRAFISSEQRVLGK